MYDSSTGKGEWREYQDKRRNRAIYGKIYGKISHEL